MPTMTTPKRLNLLLVQRLSFSFVIGLEPIFLERKHGVGSRWVWMGGRAVGTHDAQQVHLLITSIRSSRHYGDFGLMRGYQSQVGATQPTPLPTRSRLKGRPRRSSTALISRHRVGHQFQEKPNGRRIARNVRLPNLREGHTAPPFARGRPSRSSGLVLRDCSSLVVRRKRWPWSMVRLASIAYATQAGCARGLYSKFASPLPSPALTSHPQHGGKK